MHHTKNIAWMAMTRVICKRVLKTTPLEDRDLEGLHSVLERIWVKGSYLSKWLPQGERGPPKESKSG